MLLSPLGANASAYSIQVEQRWKVMNLCSKQAQKAHPDLTAESNPKREGSLQECLSGGNLPPRAPLAPTPPLRT
jgi:hypothetical protein